MDLDTGRNSRVHEAMVMTEKLQQTEKHSLNLLFLVEKEGLQKSLFVHVQKTLTCKVIMTTTAVVDYRKQAKSIGHDIEVLNILFKIVCSSCCFLTTTEHLGNCERKSRMPGLNLRQ